MKIDAIVWHVASLDSVNLPKILLGWSRIQLSPYPKLPKDRTLGTNRCSASLCFSWPAALGIKASSSFRTSTATFTSSSSSMVYRGRGSQVRRRGDKKSHSRICTSGTSTNLTPPTFLTTYVKKQRGQRFPTQFEREEEGMSKGSWKSFLHLANPPCP